MIDLEHSETAIKDVLHLKYKRFGDERGFFAETTRLSELSFINGFNIVQSNESYNKNHVMRGLHFQWEPPMGKLVRSIHGTLYDLVVDIRKGSPTYGKGIVLKLTRDLTASFDEWLWIPPGIAHGIFCEGECIIEYLCTGQYNKSGEANISPFSPEIDWGLSDKVTYDKFVELSPLAVISARDKDAPTLSEWEADMRSNFFKYKV